MPQQALGQVQWGDLTFGPGSQYAITSVQGIDDLPDIRSEDVARPSQHGDYTGPDWTGPRTVTLGLGLRGDSPDDLRALSLALRAATQPQMQPAPLQFLDQGVLVYGKVRKRSIPYDAEYLWRLGDAALEFYCADPYLYGLEEQSVSTTAYSPSAGRAYPLTYSGVTEVRNLVLNPSAEVDVANIAAYTSSGTAPTIAQNTPGFGARWGADTALVTYSAAATGGARYLLGESIPAGTPVRFIAYVYLPSTSGVSALQMLYFNGTTLINTPSSLTTPGAGGWNRIEAQFTVPVGQVCDGVGIRMTTTGASALHIDGVMATPSSATQPYVDGDQFGCVWDGTPQASMSRRVAGTGRVYGSAGTAGRLTAVNGGASPAYPVLRVDGPVASPAVEQVTTGGVLQIDASLNSGEYLLIDTRSRAVLFMGATPRRSWVRGGSSWPTLQPGANDLAYRGSALAGAPGQTSLLTVTWRDTSL
ncbi:phage distal tail protein [Streptomyces sp. NPDC059224]|uniref:phage distal tail protein n=1 Tax=Streptomyces sp. NPDC059224 TaxID=3346775 RepID=UPI0036B1BBAE